MADQKNEGAKIMSAPVIPVQKPALSIDGVSVDANSEEVQGAKTFEDVQALGLFDHFNEGAKGRAEAKLAVELGIPVDEVENTEDGSSDEEEDVVGSVDVNPPPTT